MILFYTRWKRQKPPALPMCPCGLERKLSLKRVDDLNNETTNIRNNVNVKSTTWVYSINVQNTTEKGDHYLHFRENHTVI